MPYNPRHLPSEWMFRLAYDESGFIPTVETMLATPVVDHPDMTDREREITETRTATEMTGQCPRCGARVTLPNRRTRRAAKLARRHLTAVVAHESGCPAADRSVPTWPQIMRESA
jgi:hypothetical protein